MIRTLVAISLLSWLCVMTGCGDRHRPVVREVAKEPAAEHPPLPAAPDAFHPGPMGETPAETGPVVNLGEVRLTAPAGWLRQPPRVSFIRAEFNLPRAEGDAADGRLTVSTAGGSLKDNIDRWRGQFSGKPEKESQETLKVSGIEVTLVDFSGTYVEGGMMGPTKDLPGYRMLGAIFTVAGQTQFLKATGPAKTMAAHADEFRAFVQSLQPSPAAK